MNEVLLSLIVPAGVARPVQDLLLSRPDLVPGFTAAAVDGHGSGARLVSASELVHGRAPRIQIQSVGSDESMRALIALIRAELPHADVFYWLQPLIESGHL